MENERGKQYHNIVKTSQLHHILFPGVVQSYAAQAFLKIDFIVMGAYPVTIR